MSKISSMFGLDASNDAAKQAAGQSKINAGVQKAYSGLFGDAAGDFGDYLDTLGHFNVGHAIGAALNTANQDPAQRVKAFNAGATETATKEASANAAFMRSQGYGDGATGGAGQGFFQKAQAATNEYAGQQYDPETVLKHLMAVLGAAGSGSSLYGGILQMLGSGAYGAPAVPQVQNPLVGLMGQLAGQAGSIYATAKKGAV